MFSHIKYDTLVNTKNIEQFSFRSGTFFLADKKGNYCGSQHGHAILLWEDTTLLQQQPGKLVLPVSSDGATEEVSALRQELAEMKVMMMQQQRDKSNQRGHKPARVLVHVFKLYDLSSITRRYETTCFNSNIIFYN